MPELADLADDLLAVAVAARPFYRGVEAVHEAVDLEAGGVVDFLCGGLGGVAVKGSGGDARSRCRRHYLRSGFKDHHVEAMANAMRGARDACDASADDGDSGTVEWVLGVGGFGERILSRSHWMSWKVNSRGCRIGLYISERNVMFATVREEYLLCDVGDFSFHLVNFTVEGIQEGIRPRCCQEQVESRGVDVIGVTVDRDFCM